MYQLILTCEGLQGVQNDVSPGPSLSALGSSTALVGRSSTSLLVVVLTSFLTSTNKVGISEKKKCYRIIQAATMEANLCLETTSPVTYINPLKATNQLIIIIKINTSEQDQVKAIADLQAHIAPVWRNMSL